MEIMDEQREIIRPKCEECGINEFCVINEICPKSEYDSHLIKLYNIYECSNGNTITICKKCGKIVNNPLVAHHIICYVGNSGLPNTLNIKIWSDNQIVEIDQDSCRIIFGMSGIHLYGFNTTNTMLIYVDYPSLFYDFPQLLFLNIDYLGLLKTLILRNYVHDRDNRVVADVLLELTPQCLFTGKYYDSFPVSVPEWAKPIPTLAAS